jgi:hypothetical protein
VAARYGTGRAEFLDVAIGLALVGFVATIGWARLVNTAPRRQPNRETRHDGGITSALAAAGGFRRPRCWSSRPGV